MEALNVILLKDLGRLRELSDFGIANKVQCSWLLSFLTQAELDDVSSIKVKKQGVINDHT